jgi:nucleoside 2-deoxyribosyltransferase
MKITIIGSTQYRDKFLAHKKTFEDVGHDVRIPAFDDHPNCDELMVCEHNRGLIEWADEVHIIWDQRSLGTVFDFGMAFALRKPIKIIYMEPKTIRGVMELYQHHTERKERAYAQE